MQYAFKHTVSAKRWDGTNFMDIFNMASRHDLQGFIERDFETDTLIVAGEAATLGEYVVIWPTLKDTIQVVLYDETSFEYQFGKVH
jgi:hypothetical protein